MATAPSTVGGPQSHTIRNYAAFIWSVADLLRGSGQHSLGSDEGSVDFMLPDIEMSHGANPVGVQRLENHALDLHRRYEGSRIRDLPDHDVRVHLGWVEGYASEVGQPLGESVRMDAVKRAARGGAAGYFDVKAFGDQGAACAEYLKSGREVAIEGRLHFEEFETKGGDRASRVYIVADSVEFLNSGQRDGAKSDNGQEPAEPADPAGVDASGDPDAEPSA